MTDLIGLGQTADGLSKPLIKLFEVCAAGLGKLYEPTYTRKMADAKAYAINTLSEKIKDNPNVVINCSFDGISLLSKDDIDLCFRINQRINHEEANKQKNIESIIGQAYELLSSETEVENDNVDIDWITRFFSITGEINNQQMQILWAKILSGEIKRPGTYSLRTLELLRNISQKEAAIFTKIAKYIINCDGLYIFFNDQNVYKKYGMSILDFAILNEAGLITLEALTRNIALKPSEEFALIYCDVLLLLKNKSENDIINQFPFYKLTKSGEELFQILNTESDINYISDLLGWFKNHNFSGALHKINQISDDGRIEYDDEPISFTVVP